MNERDVSSMENLTGVWSGLFKNPDGRSISFTATLIQSGNLVTGSTHEPCSVVGCPIKTHLAQLSGERSGNRIWFLKSYEPPGYGYDIVVYAGDVNAEATEIAGRWSIDTLLSGEFLMIRDASGMAKKKQRKLVAA